MRFKLINDLRAILQVKGIFLHFKIIYGTLF